MPYGIDANLIPNAKYALISASSSGDNTVLSAVTASRFLVLGYTISGAGAVTATWKSGSTGISGAIQLGTGTSVSAYADRVGVLKTLAANSALVLNLSGGTAVTGHIVYIEVAA